MFSAFLISFREAVEAALIIGLFLGMIKPLPGINQKKIIFRAATAATLTAFLVLFAASALGYRLEGILNGRNEILYEGIVQIGSAIFLLWAVFSLHKYFILQKAQLAADIKKTMEMKEERSLFWLVFILIFKEGLEVILFFSSIYLTTNPWDIFSGTILALLSTLFFATLIYKTETKIPVWYAYRLTSAILVIISASFVIKGIMEISVLFI